MSETNITYINTTLAKDEKIIGVAELHWVNYVAPVFILATGLVVLFTYSKIIGIGLLVWGIITLLDIMKREFVITNKRVISKTGIIAVKTAEIRIPKIESVCLNQSILGRIFDYSSIGFTGTGSTEAWFVDVQDPVKTKAKFEEIIERYK